MKLATLTSQSITLADTALGRHQQIIKRQENNVVNKMSQEKMYKLRKKLEEMDELQEEEHLPLIAVMPTLACKKSPTLSTQVTNLRKSKFHRKMVDVDGLS